MAPTRDALGDGDITGDHADSLTQLRAEADERLREALDRDEAELIERAKTETPEQFRRPLSTWRQKNSEDDGIDEQEKSTVPDAVDAHQRRRRHGPGAGRTRPRIVRNRVEGHRRHRRPDLPQQQPGRIHRSAWPTPGQRAVDGRGVGRAVSPQPGRHPRRWSPSPSHRDRDDIARQPAGSALRLTAPPPASPTAPPSPPKPPADWPATPTSSPSYWAAPVRSSTSAAPDASPTVLNAPR